MYQNLLTQRRKILQILRRPKEATLKLLLKDIMMKLKAENKQT